MSGGKDGVWQDIYDHQAAQSETVAETAGCVLTGSVIVRDEGLILIIPRHPQFFQFPG